MLTICPFLDPCPAAFYALLFRYTSQTDIVIGTPMACRGLAETDELVGYFINSVALRIKYVFCMRTSSACVRAALSCRHSFPPPTPYCYGRH